jgi:copper chaperone CopZ
MTNSLVRSSISRVSLDFKLDLDKGDLMKKQAILKITGLHCAGCAGSVEKALKSTPGVSKASVNLKAAKANVEYEADKITESDLVKAIKSAGFGVAP